MGNQGSRGTNHLQHLSIAAAALQFDHILLISRGEGLRNGAGITIIICIRRWVTASNILVGDNGDRSKSPSAAMVLDSEVEGDIGDSFSLDSDQNSQEVEASEADWVD
jgi:hypothetical protein